MITNGFYWILKIQAVILLLFICSISYSETSVDSTENVRRSYENAADSALFYSIRFDPEALNSFIYLADSIGKANNLEETWKLTLANAWKHIALRQYDSAEFLLEKKSSLFSRETNTQNQLTKYYHLAHLKRVLLKYSDAGKYFEKLKDLAIRERNTDYIYEAYWGLESIAKSTEDHILGKQYLEELLRLQDQNNPIAQFKTYQLYAQNAIERGEYQTGEDYLKKCLGILGSDTTIIPNPGYQLSWLYNQLGEVNLRIEEEEESIEYYKKSIEVGLKYNLMNLVTDSYANLGILYYFTRDYGKSIESFDSCLAFLKQAKNTRLMGISYYYLSTIYDSLGNYQKAYQNQKLYAQYADSNNRSNYLQVFAEEKTRFQTEQKEKELKLMAANIRTNKIILIAATSVFVLLLIIIFLIYRQSKLKSAQKVDRLEKQIAEAKQEYLRKQMNPHFLFNTLNSIQYFMFNNDKISTNDYMSKFAMLIRKTLENSEKDFNTLKDELDVIKLYIELEQLRFKNKFRYHLEVDPDIDILQTKIPTMIIHPFVENAINHGLHFVEKEGNLLVKLEHYKNETLKCTVEDNGIGRTKALEIKKLKDSKRQSMGTSITKERLDMLSNKLNEHLKISFVDLEDEQKRPLGTRVIIIIPTSV